jgi:hypothetical protein
MKTTPEASVSDPDPHFTVFLNPDPDLGGVKSAKLQEKRILKIFI